jgi:hypothetical protein
MAASSSSPEQPAAGDSDDEDGAVTEGREIALPSTGHTRPRTWAYELNLQVVVELPQQQQGAGTPATVALPWHLVPTK